jgi:hypothetical protein
MERLYSIRHLGIFSRPLLSIEENGFRYKEKLYTHDDIKSTSVSGGNGQTIRMGVKLKDGALIFINASALELNGEKTKTGFISGNNEILNGLLGQTLYRSAIR